MHEWKPNKRQEDFIRIPDSVKEAFYGGAAFGGKSELLLMLPILREWYKHPRFHGILFRKTFPQLEESLIERSRFLYEPFAPGGYNEQKHYWRFPSGAVIRFSYMEVDSDARDHDTAEYNYIGFDELTHHTYFQYIYLLSRCRSAARDLPAVMRSASNPGNIGHGWVRDRFVAPEPNGYKILADPETRLKRIFIPAKATDNPVGLQNNPDYINQLKLLPEAERKAKLEGDWFSFAGQVFKEFREKPYPNEPEHALHVIDDYTVIEPWWPQILAIDWGFEHFTCAHWLAIAPNNRAIIDLEYVARRTDIAVWGSDIGRISQDRNIAVCVLDPSAWGKRGEHKTIADQFYEASGIVPLKADNDRIGGLLNYHEYLRWTKKPPRYVPPEGYRHDLYERIFRMHGQKAAKMYADAFKPEQPETNLPKLHIKQRCQQLIKTLPLCVFDEEGKNPEDVKKFDGDDPYDCSRYGLKQVHHFLHEVEKENSIRRRTANAMAKLSEDGNYTSFVRQMETIEREKKKQFPAGPVRLYH